MPRNSMVQKNYLVLSRDQLIKALHVMDGPATGPALADCHRAREPHEYAMSDTLVIEGEIHIDSEGHAQMANAVFRRP